MKDIIQIALETEKSGAEYFGSLAEKCAYNEGVKNILQMLAKEQKRQIVALEEWTDKQSGDCENPVFFEASRGILKDLQAKLQEFTCSIDHLSLYEHARDIQRRALTNYKDALGDMQNEHYVAFLQDMVAQKEKQIILLDNIIELLLRPEQWVESPEFTKLDEY